MFYIKSKLFSINKNLKEQLRKKAKDKQLVQKSIYLIFWPQISVIFFEQA